MGGFSQRSITRKFVNTTSFCLWEISTLLRIWLFFTIRFLDHGPKGDSIVSELYHMRCYILMRVLWIERLDYDNWFLTLYFSIYICLGLFKTVGCDSPRLVEKITRNWRVSRTFLYDYQLSAYPNRAVESGLSRWQCCFMTVTEYHHCRCCVLCRAGATSMFKTGRWPTQP